MSRFDAESAWESRLLNDYLSGDDEPETLEDFLSDLGLPTDPIENVVCDEQKDDVRCGQYAPGVEFKPHAWVNGRCAVCADALLSHFLAETGWTYDYWSRDQYVKDFA